MKTIYLAGPISGLSYNEAALGWREDFREKVPGVRCLSPMRGKSHLKNIESLAPANQYADTVMSSARGIVSRDRFDVSTCDAMVVNLSGATRVSIGTMVEYGWADAFRKPIITIMDNDNLHDHDFIHELTSFRVYTLDEAANVVNALFKDDL